MTRKIKRYMIAIASVISGFCNALIGAGGGIVLSYALSKLAHEDFPDKRDVYINSQAAMIPGCMLSCLIYASRGSLDATGFSIFAIPAAIGGIIGGLLQSKIKSVWIAKLFALLVIWSGIRMLLR